jgi:hypothetical protein
MDYRVIGEPGLVKDGFLSFSEALEVLSLLPLKDSAPPEKLLRRLLLMGRAQGILVQSDSGKEYPIVQSFWQSAPADAAFKELIVSARVLVDAYTERYLKGWIVLRSPILRPAVMALLPIASEDVAFFKAMINDNIAKGFLAKKQEATFDEAVRRCRAARSAGVVAERMSVPVFATPEFQAKIKAAQLERVETVARAQAASMSLGSVPVPTVRGGHSPSVRSRHTKPGIPGDALSPPTIKQRSRPGRKKANDQPLLDQMKKLIEEAADGGNTLSANAAAYQVAFSLHGPRDLTRVSSTQSRLASKYLNG